MTTLALRTVVGANIRDTRGQRGLKQIDLADRVGIHWTNMNRIEHGRSSMSLDRLEQIAKILSVHVSDLVSMGHQQ